MTPDRDTMAAVTREDVAEALDLAWGDFIGDTGNYPDCFTSSNPRTKFSADFSVGNFAQSVTDCLNARADPIEPDPDPIEPSHNYPDHFIDLNTADLVTDVVTASDGERSIRVRRHGWQRDPPEKDGWYVVIVSDGQRSTTEVAELGTTDSGVRYSSIRGVYGHAYTPYHWLLPGIPLPPLPEEEP